MLYMVIEHFKPDGVQQMAERFGRHGRMLPKGVVYHSSWIDQSGTQCFQIMEASGPELLKAWMDRWNDLVDFEVIPVLTSADFWASRGPQ